MSNSGFALVCKRIVVYYCAVPRPRTISDAEILAAAARTIAREGPANLTLAAVAAEVGLAAATLVQRFGSKRGLLLALARQAVPELGGSFENAREHHGTPLDALHAALAGVASLVRSPEELANHLAFLQMDLSDPEFRRHAADHAQAMRGEIQVLLEDAVSAGELAGDTDVPRLARAVQVTYNGALIAWALTGDGELREALRADVDELLRPYRT